MFGAYPGIHDVGASGLFSQIADRPRRQRPWTVLGLSSGHERRMLGRLLDRRSAEAGEGAPALPPREPRLARAFTDTVAALDRMALSGGCRSWVEHTPGSPSQVAALEPLIPRLRVIHVVRDGRDELAAHCVAAAASQPRGCRISDARAAIERWNRALAAHARCLGRAGHSFVLYEDLLQRPRRELLRVLRECGLECDAAAAQTAVESLDTESARAQRAHFRGLFDSKRRRRIEARLDLEHYGRLAEYCRRGRVWEAVSESGWNASPGVAGIENE